MRTIKKKKNNGFLSQVVFYVSCKSLLLSIAYWRDLRDLRTRSSVIFFETLVREKLLRAFQSYRVHGWRLKKSRENKKKGEREIFARFVHKSGERKKTLDYLIAASYWWWSRSKSAEITKTNIKLIDRAK